MDFRSLTIEELALDDSFRNYCLKTNRKDISFWESWCQQNPDRMPEIREAKKLVLLLSGAHKEEQLINDRADFTAVVARHLDTIVPIQSRQLRLPRTYIFRAAAVLLIVATAAILFTIKKNETLSYVSSEVGERKTHILPDGTKVTLNANSRIELSTDFNTYSRDVVLEGEAFFDVKHDGERPFVIHTSKMDIKVLGTVFNVKAYPEDNLTETALIQGSVEVVMKATNEKIVLKPNEKLVLPQREPVAIKQTVKEPEFTVTHLTYDKVDSSLAEISWKENKLVFNEEGFDELAKTLRRWYNMEISFKDEAVKAFRFTATFENKTIEQVMEALQLSRPFTYSINQNEIIISK